MATDYNDTKITFQQVIFKQITIIQDITKKELRAGDKIIKNLVGEQTIEGEDTRYSFLQAVELLGSLLSPYFGKVGEGTISNKFEQFCVVYDMELKEAYEDKDFQKLVADAFAKTITKDQLIKDEGLQMELNIFFLNYKVKEARKIFRDLVKLFKDNDFLTGESYGETAGGTEEGLEAVDDDIEGEIIE